LEMKTDGLRIKFAENKKGQEKENSCPLIKE
jgi:hypothetical protein